MWLPLFTPHHMRAPSDKTSSTTWPPITRYKSRTPATAAHCPHHTTSPSHFPLSPTSYACSNIFQPRGPKERFSRPIWLLVWLIPWLLVWLLRWLYQGVSYTEPIRLSSVSVGRAAPPSAQAHPIGGASECPICYRTWCYGHSPPPGSC